MKPQFDNKVMSSFFLWFDNKLLTKGEAYENTNGLFYSTSDEYYGYQTYSSSYSQFVSDASIAGATIPVQLSVGGSPISVGSNGLYDINYLNGKAYFSASQTSTVSGNFSIKDFNIYLTNETEDQILFETKYTQRNKIDLTPEGLEANTLFYKRVIPLRSYL